MSWNLGRMLLWCADSLGNGWGSVFSTSAWSHCGQIQLSGLPILSISAFFYGQTVVTLHFVSFSLSLRIYITHSAQFDAHPRASVLFNRSYQFQSHRGTRQGCALLSLLFAIAIEPLALAIKKNLLILPPNIGQMNHHISLSNSYFRNIWEILWILIKLPKNLFCPWLIILI